MDVTPRRFRFPLKEGQKHPAGSDSRWLHGCYFPLTDLCITEMSRPGTGVPKGVEWIDSPSELMIKMGAEVSHE